MPMVNVEEAELKQLRKDNRILQKKLRRAQSDLEHLEQSAKVRENLHRQVILELQESQQVLEAKKNDLQILLQDLTETQNKLIEVEKQSALGQLVAGVAHEINTPVGTSITLASTLVDETHIFRDLTQGGKLKRSHLNHYLEVAEDTTKLILHNLNRAGEMVQTFKKVAVDQTHHELRNFEVKAYLTDVLRSLKPYFKEGNHHYEITGELVYIQGYPGLLAQIVTNFVVNSIKHAYGPEESGHLVLDVQTIHDKLVLRYTDDGCGIPEAARGKVFEPFFTTGRKSGGTGLGLHIVYNIVTQSLKGDIHLSGVEGQGTQFEVIIPIERVSPDAQDTELHQA